MKAKEKITKARAGLILDEPFFGALALRLRLIADPSCPTAWTDGRSMGYNPTWIERLSLDELKGVVCHEVMHCALAHMSRRGKRNHQRWNIAGDYAINQIIESAGMTLPKGRLLDPAYAGLSADEIYSRLPEPEEQSGEAGDGDPQASSDPGGCGEVRDAQGTDGQQPSAADLTQAAEDWRVAVAQAAQAARQAGKLPAGLERLVEDVLQPRVDWREVLRQFVDRTARSDYSWFPPNRRYVHQGLYLPSVRSEELPPLVIAVDTSGSIDAAALNQFASEMTAILEDYRTSATVIYCDASVAAVEEVTSDDLPLALHPRGGGGTDFRPAFADVERRGIMPSCLIYLTDLECASYPDAPAYPVLWAQIGDRGAVPPFGTVVRITAGGQS